MDTVKCRGHEGIVKSLSLSDYGKDENGNRIIKLNLSLDNGSFICNLFNVSFDELQISDCGTLDFRPTEAEHKTGKLNRNRCDFDNPYSMQNLGRCRCENWD